MCLLFRWFLGFLYYATSFPPLLSQNNVMGYTSKGIALSFMRNFLSQTNSFAISKAIMYLNSTVESIVLTMVLLLEIQGTWETVLTIV